MRMKDLSDATGVPRTAIHHYQREGLLPPARKTAPNAAVYGPAHVERLHLIRSLRGDELGPVPLDGVREILGMVDRGVEPRLAVALYSLPGGVGKARPGRKRGAGDRSLSSVAREAGLSLSTVRELHASGLLPGRLAADGSRVFDEADAVAAGLLAELLSHEGVRPSDLDLISELVGELARYERALTGLATSKLTAEEGRERRRALYQSLHALHVYLFSRLVPEPDES